MFELVTAINKTEFICWHNICTQSDVYLT